MSHLDTAYKLGAAAAWEDFQAMAQKEAQGALTPPPPKVVPPAKPTPAPAPAPRAPGSAIPLPAAEGIVNPGPSAGRANRGY